MTWILFLALSTLFSYPCNGSANIAPDAFKQPPSEAVDSVNPLIGNGGDTPNSSGGMIPSTAPPFAMTRWVAQTRQNYVSMTPYNSTDDTIHGFQGTHQPAIWMGESGQVVLVPGAGKVQDTFDTRGMKMDVDRQVITPSYYSVNLTAIEGGTIFAEQSATSRVGHLRFTFEDTQTPYVLLSASRPTTIASDDAARMVIEYPNGSVIVDPLTREICGTNSERQDYIIGPISTPATGFKGYFCARFSAGFVEFGVAQNGTVSKGKTAIDGPVVSGYAKFDSKTIEVRVGTSFISIDQARENLIKEIPDGTTLEQTAKATRTAWAERLDRIQLEGATEDERQIFYTGFFHTLQYPYEMSEYGRYYSGYTDSVHEGVSYTGYSIWDTYRAEWAWLILFAPERLPDMITSMLQDYKEVATHADSLIAEAIIKGVTGFDTETAWDAVYKDATVPPKDDWTTVYSDREEGVDYEVRAGLSSVYEEKGFVASDIHSEAGSRTLDYAYDDYAVSVLGAFLSKPELVWSYLRQRAATAPFTIYNNDTGFMEARNASGAWAGDTAGWTEGDKWAYSFDVVHDVPKLIAYRGGNTSFVQSLDAHFDGGHNDQTNEPSHHIPYLYSLAGRPDKTQERVREIAQANYNATTDGLSGNEDCGQMSAWYLFSALGFYPVDPVSAEYVVGTPFFSKVTINLPNVSKPLVIMASDAETKPYVKSLTLNGKTVDWPVITHDAISQGGDIVFEMSVDPQSWGSASVSSNESIDHSEL